MQNSTHLNQSQCFINHLEPQTTIYKWLFQLDDSQSLHGKWLEITKHLFINGCLGFQALVSLNKASY